MKNDLGKTEWDPCVSAICWTSDVQSWERRLGLEREKMETLLAQTPKGPMREVATLWYEESADLAPGAELITWELNSTRIKRIMESIKQGEWLAYTIKTEIWGTTPADVPEGNLPPMGPYLPPGGLPPEAAEKEPFNPQLPPDPAPGETEPANYTKAIAVVAAALIAWRILK